MLKTKMFTLFKKSKSGMLIFLLSHLFVLQFVAFLHYSKTST